MDGAEIASLPNRRTTAAVEIEWAGSRWRAQFTPFAGGIGTREIFIDWLSCDDPDGKPDAAVLSLVHDAAIFCSLLLRTGIGAAALAARVGRANRSLLALALAAAAEYDRQLREEASR